MTLGAAHYFRSPLAAAGLALALCLGAPGGVVAQTPAPGLESQLPAGKMLLEADQLLYDFDAETVSAVGGVEIYYGAYVLQAGRVTYHQRSGRLMASDGVRLLEPSGNVITADSIDITDDFRDGFVGSLNVRTIDRATFAAQSAERRDGNLTIFRKGVYTACQACSEHPERPPLWQIKASSIIHDQRAQTVYYENARLEFFGVPIAYLPYFFHPDPTVRRKTGFLTPTLRIDDDTGVGISTPFFWNLSPNYDLTFTPTFLTRQGVLMEGEFRHRILNGAYSSHGLKGPALLYAAGAAVSFGLMTLLPLSTRKRPMISDTSGRTSIASDPISTTWPSSRTSCGCFRRGCWANPRVANKPRMQGINDQYGRFKMRRFILSS